MPFVSAEDARAAKAVARAALDGVRGLHGDATGELAEAGRLLDAHGRADVDDDALQRAAKALDRACRVHRRAPSVAAQAAAYAVATVREALVACLHAEKGAPAGARARVHRCREAAREALWRCGAGGTGSGRVADARVATLWREAGGAA